MRDCANATIKDLLPDLLHNRLPGALRAQVLDHVEQCEDCRAEFQLLLNARTILVGASVQSSRIAGAIPPYRRISRWRRTVQSPQMRVAAAAVLLVGGGAGVSVLSRSAPSPNPAADTPLAFVQTSDLPVGESFADLPDSDLRELLDEIGRIEAVTPSEPEVIIVPAVGRGGA